jgi:hypothetical protein
VFRHSTSLGYFNGASQKPTWLYSNFSFVSAVDLFRTSELPKNPEILARRTVDAGGRPRYTGTSALKGSQAYPRQFGEALRLTYDKNKETVMGALKGNGTSSEFPADRIVKILGKKTGQRDWVKEGNLEEVVQFLLAAV